MIHNNNASSHEALCELSLRLDDRRKQIDDATATTVLAPFDNTNCIITSHWSPYNW